MGADAYCLLVVLIDNSGGGGDATDVVGYAWASFQNDTRDIALDTRTARKTAELHYIYVSETVRGSGSGGGRMLWNAIERAAVDAGCTYLELVADSTMPEALIRFYQRCGAAYMFCR